MVQTDAKYGMLCYGWSAYGTSAYFASFKKATGKFTVKQGVGKSVGKFNVVNKSNKGVVSRFVLNWPYYQRKRGQKFTIRGGSASFTSKFFIPWRKQGPETQGMVLFDKAINVSPRTYKGWVDLDLSSHVPKYTTAVLLEFLNTSTTTSCKIGAKHATETKDETYVSLSSKSHRQTFAWLTPDRKCKAYLQYAFGKIYLLGYSMQDIVPLRTKVDITDNQSTWVTKEVGQYLGYRETAVILEWVVEGTGLLWHGARKNGSSDNIYERTGSYRSKTYIVPTSSAHKIDIYGTSGSVLKCYLVGYIRDATQFVTTTNRTPLSLPGSGWNVLDLSSQVPVGTTGAILEVFRTVATQQVAFRRIGSTENTTENGCATFYYLEQFTVPLVSRKVEMYASDLNIVLYLVGYVLPHKMADEKAFEFFKNRVKLTPSVLSQWTQVDVSTLVPPTASFVCLKADLRPSAYAFDVRGPLFLENDFTHAVQNPIYPMFCPVINGVIELYQSGGSLYLTGWFGRRIAEVVYPRQQIFTPESNICSGAAQSARGVVFPFDRSYLPSDAVGLLYKTVSSDINENSGALIMSGTYPHRTGEGYISQALNCVKHGISALKNAGAAMGTRENDRTSETYLYVTGFFKVPATFIPGWNRKLFNTSQDVLSCYQHIDVSSSYPDAHAILFFVMTSQEEVEWSYRMDGSSEDWLINDNAHSHHTHGFHAMGLVNGKFELNESSNIPSLWLLGGLNPEDAKRLSSTFSVRQRTKGLKSKFFVKHDVDEVIFKFAVGQNSKELSQRFVVLQRHRYEQFLGKFYVVPGINAYKEAVGRISVQHTNAKNLFSKFTIQRPGSKQRLSKLIIQNVSAATSLGKFTLQRPAAKLLTLKFISQHAFEKRNIGLFAVWINKSQSATGKLQVQNISDRGLTSLALVQNTSSSFLLEKFAPQRAYLRKLTEKFVVQNASKREIRSKLRVQQLKEKRILCKFSVMNAFQRRQISKFAITRTWKELGGKFILPGNKTQQTTGKFIVANTSFKEVPSRFVVQQLSFVSHVGKLAVQNIGQWKSLGYYVVQQRYVKSSAGKFIVQQPALKRYLSKLSIQQTKHSRSIGLIVVQNKSMKKTLGKFSVQNASSQKCLGKFAVQHSSATSQLGKFAVTRKYKSLSSKMSVMGFAITMITALPTQVQRTGVHTTELRCDWHDEFDLAEGAYTCQFFTYDHDGVPYGPYSGTVVKDGTKEYHAVFDWDVPDMATTGPYDVKAVVVR